MPFATPFDKASHFLKHGHQFGAATEDAYEQLADAFMHSPKAADVWESVRPRGIDRIRFRSSVRHFGVAENGTMVVKTLYIVDRSKIGRHGGEWPFFQFESMRTDL